MLTVSPRSVNDSERDLIDLIQVESFEDLNFEMEQTIPNNEKIK